MKALNKEIVATRMKAFAERGDVRNLGMLLVAGLISPFEYVDQITELATNAGIDAPIVLN